MGQKGKYEPLTQYLLNCGKNEVIITIEEISNIVLGGLPPWVYNPERSPWSMSMNPVGSMSKAWIDAGYVVKDYSSASVTFKKQK